MSITKGIQPAIGARVYWPKPHPYGRRPRPGKPLPTGAPSRQSPPNISAKGLRALVRAITSFDYRSELQAKAEDARREAAQAATNRALLTLYCKETDLRAPVYTPEPQRGGRVVTAPEKLAPRERMLLQDATRHHRSADDYQAK